MGGACTTAVCCARHTRLLWHVKGVHGCGERQRAAAAHFRCVGECGLSRFRWVVGAKRSSRIFSLARTASIGRGTRSLTWGWGSLTSVWRRPCSNHAHEQQRKCVKHGALCEGQNMP
eukprot:4162063-Pleurochrysis_carterae.AAC.1